LGRAGFIAKGCVYGLVGIFLIVAAETGEKTEGSTGAMQVLACHPGGIVLLALISAGLIMYAMWRIFEGVFGLRVHGDKRMSKRILRRIPPLISAAIYLVYAVLNIATITNPGDRDCDNHEGGTWSAKLLRSTGGRALFFIAGLVMIGLFGWQMYESLSGNFKKELRKDKERLGRKITIWIGYPGIIGRGLFFLLMGVTMIRMVFTPSLRDDGLGGAMGEFQRNVWGKILLWVFGLFLIVYMVFCFLCARYRKFVAEGPKDLPEGGFPAIKDKARKPIDALAGNNAGTRDVEAARATGAHRHHGASGPA